MFRVNDPIVTVKQPTTPPGTVNVCHLNPAAHLANRGKNRSAAGRQTEYTDGPIR